MNPESRIINDSRYEDKMKKLEIYAYCPKFNGILTIDFCKKCKHLKNIIIADIECLYKERTAKPLPSPRWNIFTQLMNFMNKMMLLNELLREFEINNPVKNSTIISEVGLIIVSSNEELYNNEEVLGYAADIILLCNRFKRGLLATTIKQVFIVSVEGSIILIPFGEKYIIFTLVTDIDCLRKVTLNFGELINRVKEILL